MSAETEQLIELGTFGRAQGLRGEIRFWAHNPASPLLKRGALALVGRSKTQLAEMVVDRVRRDKKGLFVGFETCSDRTAAEALTGLRWFCEREAFAPLSPDEVYIADLVGLGVETDTGDRLGEVTDVVEVGPNLILIVLVGHREIMVPYVDSFIEGVSLENGLIKIKVLEGLLETGRA